MLRISGKDSAANSNSATTHKKAQDHSADIGKSKLGMKRYIEEPKQPTAQGLTAEVGKGRVT